MTRKKTLSDLINIGVVIKDLETGGCRDHLLINTAGHDRMDEVYERDRKTLNFHEEKHTTCSDRFVGDGQPRPKVPRKLFTVWNLRSHGERERLSKENIILTKQTNEWMVWHGREKAKASPARAKGRNKTKGKGKQHGKKGKTGCHEMEGTKTRKKHNSVNNTQSGRTRVGNMLTAGLMQTGGEVCGLTPAWEQAARQLPPAHPAQEQCNPTQGRNISMLDGLTMCEVGLMIE